MSKLTLYRIDHCGLGDEDLQRIFTADYPLQEIPLNADIKARLFLTHTKPHTPEWLDYLEPILKDKPQVEPISLLGAVLLMTPYNEQEVVYAATWGTGHFMLKPFILEPNLGLRTVLNLMCAGAISRGEWDAERLRALHTKRVGANPLVMYSQFARFTTLESFPFIAEADQVRSISGKPTDTGTWGNCVTGGVSLNVRSPQSPMNIITLCRQIETVFGSEAYKDYFSSIDSIKPVSDQNLTGKLTSQILFAVQAKAGMQLRKKIKDSIHGTLSRLTIAPPTLVDWDKVDKFEFKIGAASLKVDEPSWREFITFIKKNNLIHRLTPAFLFHDVRLNALNANGVMIDHWTVGSCISGEIRFEDVTYIIDEGVFYSIDNHYLNTLNREVDAIKEFQGSALLPSAPKNENEGHYIDKLTSNGNNSLKMHTATVMYKGITPIEVCDVALENHVLIHVKRGKCSSSLSHLFSQATVSAELLYMDQEFRRRVRERMDEVFQEVCPEKLEAFKWITDDEYKPAKNEIVMAIMTGCRKKDLSKLLPFFSKINLRMRCNDLRKMGYPYSVAQITTGQAHP